MEEFNSQSPVPPEDNKLQLKRHPLAIAIVVAALVFLVANAIWFAVYEESTNRLSTANNKITQLQAATPIPTPTPSGTPIPTTGTITGNIGYPAKAAPAQTICAVNTTDSARKFCVDNPGGTGSALGYQLPVPPGTYNVYASLKVAQGDFTPSYKAYYNKYVTCTQVNNCAAGLHAQYNQVTVVISGTAADVDPTDWYALGLGQ